MADKVADMTAEEFKQLMRQAIREEMTERNQLQPRQFDPEKAAEFHEWLRKNRPRLKPGSPSTLELIRKDRDRDHAHLRR